MTFLKVTQFMPPITKLCDNDIKLNDQIMSVWLA